ncbi:MAG TPA: hypothetical protein VHK91_14375 [Flavisolibacter sp.]|jgi:hypothetical protein|nr:hypothetical protein [Flavisolibacter sp.]
MATSTRLGKQEKIIKSLKKAAAILNKVNKPTKTELKKMAKAEAAMEPEVVVFQVFCPDQKKSIGGPTTDFGQAETTRDSHNEQTGHASIIISSGTN